MVGPGPQPRALFCPARSPVLPPGPRLPAENAVWVTDSSYSFCGIFRSRSVAYLLSSWNEGSSSVSPGPLP